MDIKKALSAALVGFSLLVKGLTGCAPNDAEAVKALDDNGFTNVTVTDHGSVGAVWEGCSKEDGAWYHASATNPAGKRVTMLVCCGGTMGLKACVVRSK